MHYYQHLPGHICLKDEISSWIGDAPFGRIILDCKKKVQTEEARGHTCNANVS